MSRRKRSGNDPGAGFVGGLWGEGVQGNRARQADDPEAEEKMAKLEDVAATRC